MHTTDKRWTQQVVDVLFSGRDGHTPMRKALRGNRRGISFQFQERQALQDEGIDLLLLWKRGEPIALARQRLAAIAVDPAAGRAPRDHVLPAYETIADLLPRPVRIDLHRWSTEGSAIITTFPLADAQPRSTTVGEHMDGRWTISSPLRRAASGALAHLENTGHAPDRIVLHGQPLAHGASDDTIDCFIDLHWRYWRSAHRYLEDGQEWFEVLPATPRQPLHALHITPTRP
ncbi:nucleotidyltransferase domain-containing protein [Streptomyces wedmorensis]